MKNQQPGIRHRAPRLSGLALAGCLLWTACFDLEEPVQERLLFSFLADGGLRIRLSVELRHPEGEKSGLAKRLRQLEAELLAGTDPWPRRFAEPESAIESFFWEKHEGRLVYLERNLVLHDPRTLESVLVETAIQPTFRVAGGAAELALFPGLPQRASRRERREMEEVLTTWSGQLEVYFAAAEELYRYLESQPHRAVACFGAIFENEADYGPLTPAEEAVVEAFGDASGEVVGVLDVDADRGYSLEELSRRVYDPFPALVTVEIPATAVEVEGFAGEAQRWAVPGLSLWTALEMLAGEWLDPDPLLAWVEHERSSPEGSFDVVGFSAGERFAAAPGAGEIRDALEAGLAAADVYRVAWRVSDDEDL